MRTSKERRLITESPDTHISQRMQSYITTEVARPCKQWIHEVLSSKREAERVKLRTSTFVLLPDVDCIHKRFRKQDHYYTTYTTHPITNPLYFWQGVERGEKQKNHTNHNNNNNKITRRYLHPSFHWLAMIADTSLRTLRDLRGEHVPMLQLLHTQACQKIFEEYGIEAGQVLAYVHYPPSVYQLHIHFKNLSDGFHDTFRVHPLLTIINNLKIDPDYYKKSHLQLPVYMHTELYSALTECTKTSIGSTPDSADSADSADSTDFADFTGFTDSTNISIRQPPP